MAGLDPCLVACNKERGNGFGSQQLSAVEKAVIESATGNITLKGGANFKLIGTDIKAAKDFVVGEDKMIKQADGSYVNQFGVGASDFTMVAAQGYNKSSHDFTRSKSFEMGPIGAIAIAVAATMLMPGAGGAVVGGFLTGGVSGATTAITAAAAASAATAAGATAAAAAAAATSASLSVLAGASISSAVSISAVAAATAGVVVAGGTAAAAAIAGAAAAAAVTSAIIGATLSGIATAVSMVALAVNLSGPGGKVLIKQDRDMTQSAILTNSLSTLSVGGKTNMNVDNAVNLVGVDAQLRDTIITAKDLNIMAVADQAQHFEAHQTYKANIGNALTDLAVSIAIDTALNYTLAGFEQVW